MTTSNVTMDTKVKERNIRTENDTWYTIMSFAVPEGKTVEVYVSIVGANDAHSSRAKWSAEGLFYRNVAGNVTADGTVTKPKHGGLAADVDIVANTTDQTVDIKVQGIAATVIFWESVGEIRLREDTEDYTGDPRIQMTIVGMLAAKKLGFMGLGDGLNHVLVPTMYNLSSAPISGQELWRRTVTKTLGGSTYTDWLNMAAQIYGSSTTVSSWVSTVLFRWWTGTGDFGTGSVSSKQFTMSLSGSGQSPSINGKLRNRALAGSYKSSENVSFVWGKHDAVGWANYT